MRTKELSLWSPRVHYLKGWGAWTPRGGLGAKVNCEPTAGWVFFFPFKMILLKVFIEPHPDSRSSCQADPVKTSCSSGAAAVEPMQATEWWEGTVFSPPNCGRGLSSTIWRGENRKRLVEEDCLVDLRESSRFLENSSGIVQRCKPSRENRICCWTKYFKTQRTS